ncbi:hypothetical protein [Oscillospiraceae bacterium]|nr:hypothetical protein [Oscillospiraceae bacterium]
MIAYAVIVLLMMWVRPQGIIGTTNTVMAQKSVFAAKFKKKHINC